MYDFRNVRGHVEVYLEGQFQFSADNMSEAQRELRCDYEQDRADR